MAMRVAVVGISHRAFRRYRRFVWVRYAGREPALLANVAQSGFTYFTMGPMTTIRERLAAELEEGEEQSGERLSALAIVNVILDALIRDGFEVPEEGDTDDDYDYEDTDGEDDEDGDDDGDGDDDSVTDTSDVWKQTAPE